MRLRVFQWASEMPKLTKITLILTLGYFILWLLGPLFFSASTQQNIYFGLPLWFWISGFGGPLILLSVIFYLTSKRVL